MKDEMGQLQSSGGHDPTQYRADQEAEGLAGVCRCARDGAPHRTDAQPALRYADDEAFCRMADRPGGAE